MILRGDRNILDLILGSVYMSIQNFKTYETIHLIVVYSIVYKLSISTKKEKFIYILKLYG